MNTSRVRNMLRIFYLNYKINLFLNFSFKVFSSNCDNEDLFTMSVLTYEHHYPCNIAPTLLIQEVWSNPQKSDRCVIMHRCCVSSSNSQLFAIKFQVTFIYQHIFYFIRKDNEEIKALYLYPRRIHSSIL